MQAPRAIFPVLMLAALGAGCDQSPAPAPAAVDTEAGHVHSAPHAGTLVELGEHAYSLEFVHDAAAGTLTAYVLDGHAENFVRIPAPAIDLLVTAPLNQPLSLRAVANSATGETVGDTAQFEATAVWLRGSVPISGTIPAITIRGTAFANVPLEVK